MKISIQNKKSYKSTNGFTIVELVVVIAGLAALSAIAIPNILNSIKLSRIEESKAIMNGYIADCLGQFRVATNGSEFYENAFPEELDEIKLDTLGYKIDGEKRKCSGLAIVPSDEDDEFRYAYEFAVDGKGKVFKRGEPTVEATLNSCRGWAGKECSLSSEKAAAFAAAAALAAKESECMNKYNTYKFNIGDGATTTWNPDPVNQCNKTVWLFNGSVVTGGEKEYEALVLEKFGTICRDWVAGKKQSKYISKIENGNPKAETIDPECNNTNYYFHTGEAYTSEIDWKTRNNEYQSQKCNESRDAAIRAGKKGEFTDWPFTSPTPCGVTVWLCENSIKTSMDDYKTTSCYKTASGGGGSKGGGFGAGGNKGDSFGAGDKKGGGEEKNCKGVKYSAFVCKGKRNLKRYSCRCAPGGIWNK